MNHAAPLPTVDWYLDRARERAGLDSDRKLSLALGLAGVGVHYWRSRKSWPDEEHMARLCELAQVPVEQGLLDLARWRAKGRTADVWRSIRAAIVPAVAVAVISLSGVELVRERPDLLIDAKAGAEIAWSGSVYYGYLTLMVAMFFWPRKRAAFCH